MFGHPPFAVAKQHCTIAGAGSCLRPAISNSLSTIRPKIPNPIRICLPRHREIAPRQVGNPFLARTRQQRGGIHRLGQAHPHAPASALRNSSAARSALPPRLCVSASSLLAA